jgi:hypothetical protein
MTELETFTIIRHRKDGDVRIAHGTLPEVTAQIPDSKVIKQKLTIINDAAHAESKLLAIRDRERAVASREDSVKRREDAVAEAEAALLMDSIRKLDQQVSRMDAQEARRIQAKLDALPDPDAPGQFPAPRLPAAISLNEEPSHADDT